MTPEYQTKVGSAGKAIPKGKIKIEDPNENGEGEILIKSPTLMIGYYENEEETKKAIDSDGYFHSGDVGYMDKDGYIFITGRSKNVIVTQNGKNIYPEEIEMLLDKIEEIKEIEEDIKNITFPKEKCNLSEYLKRPEVKIIDYVDKLNKKYSKEALEQVEINHKYEGYILKLKKKQKK